MTLCSEVTEHLKMYPSALPFPLTMEESSSLDGKASPMDGKSERVGELVVVVEGDEGDEVVVDSGVGVLPMIAVCPFDEREESCRCIQTSRTSAMEE